MKCTTPMLCKENAALSIREMNYLSRLAITFTLRIFLNN